jgi:hypothetical protein
MTSSPTVTTSLGPEKAGPATVGTGVGQPVSGQLYSVGRMVDWPGAEMKNTLPLPCG